MKDFDNNTATSTHIHTHPSHTPFSLSTSNINRGRATRQIQGAILVPNRSAMSINRVKPVREEHRRLAVAVTVGPEFPGARDMRAAAAGRDPGAVVATVREVEATA